MKSFFEWFATAREAPWPRHRLTINIEEKR